jgi:hypothetical protein
LVKLNAIATQQASPAQKTMERVKQELLDYCASQEEVIKGVLTLLVGHFRTLSEIEY